MVRHIVMWNYLEGFTEEQNKNHAQKVKAELEGLTKLIEGIHSLTVEIDPLPSSNRDAILNSVFESEEALASYQIHPEHIRVSRYVGSVIKNRACIDYFE